MNEHITYEEVGKILLAVMKAHPAGITQEELFRQAEVVEDYITSRRERVTDTGELAVLGATLCLLGNRLAVKVDDSGEIDWVAP